MAQQPEPISPSRSLSPVYRRLAELQWPVVIIVIGAAAVQQALIFALLRRWPELQQGWLHLVVSSIVGVAVAGWGLRALVRAAARQDQAEAQVRMAYDELEHTNHQLRAIYEVGRRIANSSDINELLHIAGQMPVELLDAAGASVITFDPDTARSRLDLAYGFDAGAVQALRQHIEDAHAGASCLHCQPLTAQVNAACSLLASVQTAGAAANIDRIVCMPLGRSGHRSGIVSAYLQPDQQPSEEQIHLASILATEITAALEAARLRNRQMATLYAVDQATQQPRTLDSLLSRVLHITIEGWGVESGAILLAVGDSWDVRAHSGMGHDLGAAAFGLALRQAERARRGRQPVILQERAAEDPFASTATLLLQTEGEIRGALFLASAKPAVFQPAQVELMKAIASQIALAVRNAQLDSQLRQTALLEERYRLSREMHDGVAQTLGYLGMQAERLETLVERGDYDALPVELKDLRHVIAQAYLDLRETIDGLRLTVDQPGGFLHALQTHIEDFTRRFGLPVDYSAVDAPADLPPETALHLLRITQEALTNVRRHAHAQHVVVSLARQNGALELTIADDGLGFDLNTPAARTHVGLTSMRERVRSLDGQLTLATSPGQGTRVSARVPLHLN